MSGRVSLFSSFLALLCILLPCRTSSADPVVTGTFEIVNIGAGAGIGGFSDGTVTVIVAGTGFIDAFRCWPLCRAGTEVSFSGSFSSLQSFVQLTSPSVVLPPEFEHWTTLTISLPFSFVAGEEHPTTGMQTLAGGGTVTANFLARPFFLESPPDPIPPEFAGTFFFLRGATFVAGQDPPPAVPEPASILLIGGGLAALGAWRRGRAQKEKAGTRTAIT